MIILVCCPESSGTRVMAAHIGTHPDIYYPPDESGTHRDPLDMVWTYIKNGQYEVAKGRMIEALQEHRVIMSRRSFPHGSIEGERNMAARWMDFPPLEVFARLCEDLDVRLVLLVCVRSPMANVVSMMETRRSVRSAEGVPPAVAAMMQYQSAYASIFEAMRAPTTASPFYIVPLEALVLDGLDFINGVWRLLGLMPGTPHNIDLDLNVNAKRYERGAEIFKTG